MPNDTSQGDSLESIRPVASDAGAPLVLRYEYTRFDRFRALAWMQLRNRVMIGFYILLFAYNGWRALRDTDIAPIAIRLVATAIHLGFVAAVCTTVSVLVPLALAFLSTDRSVVGAIALSVTDEGAFERNAVSEGLHRWRGMYGVLDAHGFVFLRISESKFLAIPHRVFGTDEDRRAFVRMTQGRIAGAASLAASGV